MGENESRINDDLTKEEKKPKKNRDENAEHLGLFVAMILTIVVSIVHCWILSEDTGLESLVASYTIKLIFRCVSDGLLFSVIALYVISISNKFGNTKEEAQTVAIFGIMSLTISVCLDYSKFMPIYSSVIAGAFSLIPFFASYIFAKIKNKFLYPITLISIPLGILNGMVLGKVLMATFVIAVMRKLMKDSKEYDGIYIFITFYVMMIVFLRVEDTFRFQVEDIVNALITGRYKEWMGLKDLLAVYKG